MTPSPARYADIDPSQVLAIALVAASIRMDPTAGRDQDHIDFINPWRLTVTATFNLTTDTEATDSPSTGDLLQHGYQLDGNPYIISGALQMPMRTQSRPQ